MGQSPHPAVETVAEDAYEPRSDGEHELVRKWAGNAIAVRDACNLSGVAHSLSRFLKEMAPYAYAPGRGTDWLNQHPIAMMFCDKMDDLSGRGGGLFNAYKWCEKHKEQS